MFIFSVIISIAGGISGSLAGNVGGLVASIAAWVCAAILASLTLTGSYISNDSWSNARFSGGIIGSLLWWGMGFTFALFGLRRYGLPELVQIAIAQFVVLVTSGILAIFCQLLLEKLLDLGFSKFISFSCILLSIFSGIFLGIQIILKESNLYIFTIFLLTFLGFLGIILYPIWEEIHLIKQYHQTARENLLIEP